MKLAGIGFTLQGRNLLKKLEKLSDIDLTRYRIHKDGDERLAESLSEFVKIGFERYDGIIFIGACGIAVRAIAPFLRSKCTDPAVLVIDECGKFVIPIASGHLGGANYLAELIAKQIHAIAVITTATDIKQVFAIDVWAKEQHLFIQTPQQIKNISSALLQGKTVGFVSDFPWNGKLPKGIQTGTDFEIGICISQTVKFPFSKTMLLTPKPYILGIGCRKGIDVKILQQQIQKALEVAKINISEVRMVCSIEQKSQEPALVEWCHNNHLPFICYTAEELASVEGEFSSSEFVKQTVGVENVCERAAVLGSSGELVLPKFSGEGVTIAIAECEINLNF